MKKLLVLGGTGFIGKRLIELATELSKDQFEIRVKDWRRDKDWESCVPWADAIVNLAGTPVFGKRWNLDVKASIYDSRIDGTKRLVHLIRKARTEGHGPRVLINGSAIGIYPASAQDSFDESSLNTGSDFLAFVCRDWEEAARAAGASDCRVVLLRTGIVLGKDGGALAQLLPPFRLGLGGPIGSGKLWMSWIHRDDLCQMILWALGNESVHGPLNGVSPNPVQNKEFTKALGRALNRPTMFPIPPIALHLLFGEAAGIITASQKILPKNATDLGFQFKYTKIDAALQDCVNK